MAAKLVRSDGVCCTSRFTAPGVLYFNLSRYGTNNTASDRTLLNAYMRHEIFGDEDGEGTMR